MKHLWLIKSLPSVVDGPVYSKVESGDQDEATDLWRSQHPNHQILWMVKAHRYNEHFFNMVNQMS